VSDYQADDEHNSGDDCDGDHEHYSPTCETHDVSFRVGELRTWRGPPAQNLVYTPSLRQRNMASTLIPLRKPFAIPLDSAQLPVTPGAADAASSSELVVVKQQSRRPASESSSLGCALATFGDDRADCGGIASHHRPTSCAGVHGDRRGADMGPNDLRRRIRITSSPALFVWLYSVTASSVLPAGNLPCQLWRLN